MYLHSRYKSREDFIADVRLIFDNCEIFNEDDSPVGKAGHGMRKFFEVRWAELTDKHSWYSNLMHFKYLSEWIYFTLGFIYYFFNFQFGIYPFFLSDLNFWIYLTFYEFYEFDLEIQLILRYYIICKC